MANPFERNDAKNTPTSTEDSHERGLVDEVNDADDPKTYSELGQSQELDSDPVGDIADEGRGHRG